MSTTSDANIRRPGPARPRFAVAALRLAAAALATAAMPAIAQFTQFQGGKVYLDVEGNMSPFAVASNTGARGAMGNVTTLYPSSSSLFGNPAAMARIPGMSVQADFFLPGLGLGVSSERTKILRNNMRAPIQEFLDGEDNNVEHPVYPDINMGLYQSTDMSGFAVSFGGQAATLGAGVQQPFKGNIDFGLGGLRLGLGLPEDESDPQSDSIKVLISADAFARVSTELNDFALGVAGSPRKNLQLGAAYHRYTADMLLEAGARVDGILQRAGQESYFHGEGVNYHDDLDAHGLGQLRGAAHGIRLGAGWRFTERFGLDAMVSMVETMRLDGQLEWDWNILPSLDFGGEQVMDPAKMNPTKLTLTTRTKGVLKDVKVNLPWEGAVSLHTQWERFRFNFDYSYFLRGLSIQFTTVDSVDAFDSVSRDVYKTSDGRDSVEVTTGSTRFRLGLNQQFALGIQIHQVWLQLGGIVYDVRQDDLIEEAAAYQPSFLPFLPTLNMGYFFPLGPRFTATVSLVAFPVSLFKTSVEYRY